MVKMQFRFLSIYTGNPMYILLHDQKFMWEKSTWKNAFRPSSTKPTISLMRDLLAQPRNLP